jgi:hypothetical protein
MVRDGTVSEQDIEVELFQCKMTGQYRLIHVDELGPWVRTFVVNHLLGCAEKSVSLSMAVLAALFDRNGTL